MHDGLGLAQRRAAAVYGAGCAAYRVHGLPHIGEIGLEVMAELLAGRRDVDIHDGIAVREQIPDGRAPGLAAATGYDHAFHGCSPRASALATVRRALSVTMAQSLGLWNRRSSVGGTAVVGEAKDFRRTAMRPGLLAS